MSATEEQQRVIDAPLLGPHLVDAGAGTGKTFTLVERAVALVASGALEPRNLLVVTFTRAAAVEIASRLEQRFLDRKATGRPTCGTFHQIATALLREFAYDTGTSPDVRAVEDVRARAIFARAFRDLLDGRLGIETSALPLLDRTPVLERNLAGIALRLKNTNVSIDEFEREALEAADDLERMPFGAIVHLTQKGAPRAGWPRPDPALTIKERFNEAARERINIRAVSGLFRHFDGLLDAENLATFGDVLTRATAMFRNFPTITANLRLRWRHAMVDEFQDSNRIQVEFLKALFGDELVPLLVVGDVRQAIYAFNGADPDGIVDFRTMAGCERYPLSVNRRSYKAILDLAHHTLANADAVPAELHNELIAHRGESGATAVRAQLFTGDGALEREADAVAHTAYCLVRDGASPKSIAVLMRSRSRAPLFAAALRRYGLAVQLHGGAGFFGAPEIREVVAWLRLVETPDDIASLVVVLQSAAIGFGDGVVAKLATRRQLADDALVESLDFLSGEERIRIERFRGIARITSTLADVPLADAVRTVAFQSGAEIARIGGEAGELDQVRANLDKLVRLAADFATDRPTARIADFLIELDERAELDDDEAEAELEGDRIALMTVHAAKGLEWDHVFVANVSPLSFPLSGPATRDVVVKLDESRHALAFASSTDGRTPLRWHLATNEVNAVGHVSPQPRDNREEHRLFYVALTRARNSVYVTGRLFGNGVTPSACLTAVRSWLADQGADPLATQLVVDENAAWIQERVPAAIAELQDIGGILLRLEAQLARATAAPPLANRRGPLSYSAIALHDACPRRARYHYVLGIPDLSEEASAIPLEGDHREPSRREPARFGRIVHSVLESVALARIAGHELAVDRYLDAAMEDEECFADATLRSDARRASQIAMLALSDLTPLAAEQRFDIQIDGVALSGYIDLLARDAKGRLTVVDYKTGYTPTDQYAMQFALYREAVGRHHQEAVATLLLRIGAHHARLEAVAPASASDLSAAVASAQAMDSDEPRPGDQCRTCPYALIICDSAPAAFGANDLATKWQRRNTP